MSFQGNFSTIPFPDVLQLLTVGKKSGTLAVIQGETRKEIYFKDGRIIAASSDSPDDRLDTYLIKRGSIARLDSERAIKAQELTGKSLAATMLELNIISQEQLSDLLRAQVEELIFRVFSWDTGSFEFAEGRLPQTDYMLSAINTMNLLMEGTRRIDEWTRVQKLLPPENSILRVVPSGPKERASVQLTGNEISVLSLIDGERSIEEVREKSNIGEFETSKAIYGLVMAGLVEPNGVKRSKKSLQMEEDHLLRTLIEIYGIAIRLDREVMIKKVGQNATNALRAAFKKAAGTYILLAACPADDGLSFNGESLQAAVQRLPREGRLHQLTQALNALIAEQMQVITNQLGERQRIALIDNIRTQILPTVEGERELLQRYGILEDVTRAFK